ncbi:hypothetical protein JCM6882_000246, partial [Rhodosporidiobolus microsporus]
ASSFEEANANWNELFKTARSFSPPIDAYFAPFWLTPLWETTAEDLELSAVGNWFAFGEIGGTGQVTADADAKWHDAAVERKIDYWAPVGAHFSVHQDANRNYVYKGGDFLLPTHYSDLINLGDRAPEFVEAITLSDWGESTYIGPLHDNNDPPVETLDTAKYVDNHDHAPFGRLMAYYNHWYKKGSPPEITSEAIFWWHRGHPESATPTNDPLPKPDGATAMTDTIYCVVFVPPGSKASKLVITTGGQAKEGQAVVEGVNLISTDFSFGKTSVDANGNELIAGEGQEIIDNPEIYDFNYYAFAVPADVIVSDFLNTGASSSSGSASSTSAAATSTASTSTASQTTSTTGGATSSSTSAAPQSTGTDNCIVKAVVSERGIGRLLNIVFF